MLSLIAPLQQEVMMSYMNLFCIQNCQFLVLSFLLQNWIHFNNTAFSGLTNLYSLIKKFLIPLPYFKVKHHRANKITHVDTFLLLLISSIQMVLNTPRQLPKSSETRRSDRWRGYAAPWSLNFKQRNR